MKKNYAKPMVTFESFAFSSNIAGGCGDIIGMHTDENGCAVYGNFSEPGGTRACQFVDNGFRIFYSDAGSGCMMGPQEDELGNLCYHVSTDATRMFMS